MPELLTYSKFQTAEDAQWLTRLLDKNGISYTITHEVNQLDKIYIGESFDPMYELKINKEDFKRLSALLTQQAVDDMRSPTFEHYFQSFDEQELKEIIEQPHDWNAYDVQVAISLLKDKFHQTVKENDDITISKSYTPERLSGNWIAVGYISCLLTVFGIFFGLSIVQARKTLSSGERVHIYDAETISHGKKMILIGLITSGIFVARILFNSL